MPTDPRAALAEALHDTGYLHTCHDRNRQKHIAKYMPQAQAIAKRGVLLVTEKERGEIWMRGFDAGKAAALSAEQGES